MNSMSKYNKDDCDPCKKDKKESSVGTILKCSNSITTALPPLAIGESFRLATLRLNTSKLKNPCVRLDFIGSIDVLGAALSPRLLFQVYKQCDGQTVPIPIGPAFTFGPIAVGADSFSFFVCDCDHSCDDSECCTYYVELSSSIEITIGDMSFRNATLSALAVSNPTSC